MVNLAICRLVCIKLIKFVFDIYISGLWNQPIRLIPFGPEAVLFTFSKMAAGMYLEHYLDSKPFIMSFNAEKHSFLLPLLRSLYLVV